MADVVRDSASAEVFCRNDFPLQVWMREVDSGSNYAYPDAFTSEALGPEPGDTETSGDAMGQADSQSVEWNGFGNVKDLGALLQDDLHDVFLEGAYFG